MQKYESPIPHAKDTRMCGLSEHTIFVKCNEIFKHLFLMINLLPTLHAYNHILHGLMYQGRKVAFFTLIPELNFMQLLPSHLCTQGLCHHQSHLLSHQRFLSSASSHPLPCPPIWVLGDAALLESGGCCRWNFYPKPGAPICITLGQLVVHSSRRCWRECNQLTRPS